MKASVCCLQLKGEQSASREQSAFTPEAKWFRIVYGIHKTNIDFSSGKTWQKQAFIWLEPAGVTPI